MTIADVTNGSLELIGGLLQCANVVRLHKDKMVRGANWWFTGFFAAWGVWNCYYYPSLDQWCSFAGGTVIVLANSCWVALAITYRHR